MRIELLYFDRCPSHEAFLPRLQELLARKGVRDEIEQRRVPTPEDAETERFLGSPTLRIDGVDVDPGAADRTDYGFKCRLYRSEKAGTTPIPPDEWVLTALQRARPADPAEGDGAAL